MSIGLAEFMLRLSRSLDDRDDEPWLNDDDDILVAELDVASLRKIIADYDTLRKERVR